MYLDIEYIEFIATSYNLSSANPQNGQKLSKTSRRSFWVCFTIWLGVRIKG